MVCVVVMILEQKVRNDMKLIIEIPEDYYKCRKYEVDHDLTNYSLLEAIGRGIPFDDVKAEMEKQIKRDLIFAKTNLLVI